MADPSVPEPSWWTVVLAVVGGGAVTTVWRPLGGWVSKRLAISDREHASALSTCRKEIETLRKQFEQHREESEQTIRELIAQVARLETRLEERAHIWQPGDPERRRGLGERA